MTVKDIVPVCALDHPEGEHPDAEFVLPVQSAEGVWVFQLACQEHQDTWLAEWTERPFGYLLVEISP